MVNCPKCSGEIGEGDSFCKHCGMKLSQPPQGQADSGSSPADQVKEAVVKRLDGIKNRDEAAVRGLIDTGYSKFDDWPPYERQDAAKALENEFGAFKVMSDYSYELKDFEANVSGDMAVATYAIHYRAVMRGRPYEVTSRVTTVLRKQDSEWKLIHEHYSRFPEQRNLQQFAPRRTIQP